MKMGDRGCPIQPSFPLFVSWPHTVEGITTSNRERYNTPPCICKTYQQDGMPDGMRLRRAAYFGPRTMRILFIQTSCNTSILPGLLRRGRSCPMTMRTSRPSRTRQSIIFASLMPRKRPLRRCDSLDCATPRISEACFCVSFRASMLSAIAVARCAFTNIDSAPGISKSA